MTNVLSVVIICRNEEQFIGRCIEAALGVRQDLSQCEVLVVDSASTDRTLSIAARYPVSIIQLRPEWTHTPAAGRYIGYHRTRGRYVAFIDGDSELIRGFAERAMEHFDRDPSVAGMVGRRVDIYYDKSGLRIGQKENLTGLAGYVTKVPMITGSAILRRAALEKVGTYNPFLYAEEELELSDRLTEAGYTILGIPTDMIVHHTVPRETISTLRARVGNRFHLGTGQVVRLRIGRSMSTDLRGRFFHTIRPVLYLAATAIILVLCTVLETPLPLSIWMAISFAGFAYMVIKGGSLIAALRYCSMASVYAIGFIRGFLMQPHDPECYPTDAIFVK